MEYNKTGTGVFNCNDSNDLLAISEATVDGIDGTIWINAHKTKWLACGND